MGCLVATTLPVPVSDDERAAALSARRAWAALEPLHNIIYFDPRAHAIYRNAGLIDPRASYLASRACPLGPVDAEAVIATFYNFSPDGVRLFVPQIWSVADPETAWQLRLTAVGTSLGRLLGEDRAADVAEAAALCRRAVDEARRHPHGRPLFAAHATRPWPDDPLLELWFAHTLLREFRGDAHMATLLTAGISGVEALILFVADETTPPAARDPEALRLTRGWPIDVWRAAETDLRRRELLAAGPELNLAPAGRELRAWIEERTDAAALVAYAAIGVDGCERLAELGTALSAPAVAAGHIPWLRTKPAPPSRRARMRRR
jgi:hypothetical protein